MSTGEEEQFARDVARAIELSRITALQDSERRKKYRRQILSVITSCWNPESLTDEWFLNLACTPKF